MVDIRWNAGICFWISGHVSENWTAVAPLLLNGKFYHDAWWSLLQIAFSDINFFLFSFCDTYHIQANVKAIMTPYNGAGAPYNFHMKKALSKKHKDYAVWELAEVNLLESRFAILEVLHKK